MPNLVVDNRSKVPIYVQLVEQIRRMVAAGDLPPGTQLPTVRQLATDLRVNFNTVARAYRVLDEAGLISTRQGQGTYVLEVDEAGNGERLRQLALDELVRSFVAEAARLGLEPGQVSEAVEHSLSEWQEKVGLPADAGTASIDDEE